MTQSSSSKTKIGLSFFIFSVFVSLLRESSTFVTTFLIYFCGFFTKKKYRKFSFFLVVF